VFFFQAEDGIRYRNVTGVQTCALPILTTRALFDAMVEVAAERKKTADHEQRWLNLAGFLLRPGTGAPLDAWRARVMWGVFNEGRSEERRVGRECRSGWWAGV